MESNTIVDTNKEASNGEEVISTRQTSNDQSQDPPTSGKTIRRENDSLDDFEHLEHEPSPHEETRGDMNNLIDVTSGQLIGAPRVNRSKASNDSRVTELMNVASKLERDILDTGVPVDEKFLQPVPATPPPSANFDKYEQLQGPLDVTTTTSAHVQQQQQQQQQLDSAQTSPEFVAQNYELDLGEKHRLLSEIRPDDYQQTHNQMDSKAATMAFMETERTLGGDDFNRANVNIEKRNEEQDKRVDEFFADEKILNPNIDDRAVSGGKDNAGSLNARLAPDKNDEKSSVHILKDTKSEENIKERSISPIKTKSLMDDEDVNEEKKHDDFVSDITSSVLPGPEKSPEFDFLAGETSPNLETRNIPPSEAKNLMDDDTWNLVENPENKTATNFTNKEIIEESHNAGKNYHDEAPTKPLPPLPKNEIEEEHESFARRTDFERERLQHDETFEMSNDFMSSAGSKATRGQQQQQSGAETGDSEFESAPEQSPAKSTTGRSTNETSAYYSGRKVNADDIAPKEIFTDMGLDAWFNPERLNPKVAALIYWRQPEKTGVVFGAILGVLLSLAYFSLISVFAYLSLLILTGTVGFRVYKTFMQAVQKTSDGHPFKDILEIDLTLPAEKVHEVADVAVAHANAAVAELRRRFLVEDFIDSLKFGVVLWCFTYVGSWFNGMTLIIIGVVALFTLPKVYETNKAQIDQNVALVQGKINELTAKVRAAIPLGKKAEPTKEE